MAASLTRRTFLAGAAGAGVVALTGNWRAFGQSTTEVARGGVFAQSVASGQPSPDGITLWTKLSQLERPGLVQYRSDQPCGDPVAQPCPEAESPGRTMLGPEQKAWFTGGLAASRATWKLVGNPLMVMALELVPKGASFTYDSWDGYKAERRELLDFIGSRGIRDVAFLTGDIHTFFAGNVTPSGREGPGEPAAVATEFVGGAITSQGIADQYAGESGAPAVAFPADAVIKANNPHLRFSNQQYKGYGVLEARPDELLVQYKSPRTVLQPRATSFTLARFRVARGRPNVEVLA